MKIYLPIWMAVCIFFIACKEQTSVDVTNATGSPASSSIPQLFERQGALSQAAEWEQTKLKVGELMQKIASNPGDVKSRMQLAVIYISEARITGEHPYYYTSILNILDGVLNLEPNNFEALVLKSSVKMSQHKFGEAKQLAETAKNLNPDNAYVYGILVDANVELGDYKAALAHSDKMQALKPSLESYARASYLREIFGDYNGSIKAMELAMNAGLPGSEPYCWSAITLAELYSKTGDLDKAEATCRKVLEVRPSYSFAFGQLAEIAMKKQQYELALLLLDSAAAIIPEFSFHEMMADVYAAQGNEKKAREKYADVARMLDEDEKSGHTMALEKAKLYMKMGAWDSAAKYAQEEYAVRPNNIVVNKEMAEIANEQNNKAAAKKYLTQAQSTGNKDPELLALAAIIQKS